MSTIAAVLIVRDEAAVVEECLAALEGVVDEIVVTDTGSADDTVRRARGYTDRISEFAWCDDFAAARNFALGQAAAEWALVVDADEVLDNRDEARGLLDAFIAQHGPGTLGEIEIVNALGRGPDAQEAVDRTPRFFARAHYRYAGAIHEQPVPAAEPAQTPRAAFTGVRVRHAGYAQPADGPHHKAQRNLRLLTRELEAHPNDEYLHYQAGKAFFALHQYGDAAASFEAALGCIRFHGSAPPQGRLGAAPRKVLTGLVCSLAYAYANEGRHAEADELLTYHGALGHAGTRRADFWYALGYVRLMRGDLAGSRAAFEAALALGPAEEDVRGTGSFTAAYQMGLLAEAERDVPGAAAWYRRAIGMHRGCRPAIARCIDLIAEYGAETPADCWAAADPRALEAEFLRRIEDFAAEGALHQAARLARTAGAFDPRLAEVCRERIHKAMRRETR